MQLLFLVVFVCLQIIAAVSDDSSPDGTLFDRKLIKKHPTSEEILDNYQKYILGANNAENGVLGVISDNEDSYKSAVVYAKKFTYFTPLWFNIERTGLNQYKITGYEKIDRKWVEELIGKNSEVRIVPRMSFNGWTSTDLIMLAVSEMEWINLSKELLGFCEVYHFHGLNLDLFNSWYGKLPNTILIGVLQEISARLRLNYFVSMLIVPPKYVNSHYFNREMFEDLAEYLSGVALMTLNHLSVTSIEDYVTDIATEEIYRSRIFFGIEFDGYNDKCGKVTKEEYIKHLKSYDEALEYDDEKSESYFEITDSFGGKQTIHYPTLQCINERISLANTLGTGVVVYCVGDGLDYFYELL